MRQTETIEDLILSKIYAAAAMAEKVNKIATDITRINLGIGLDYINVVEGKIHVVVGTKENPKGISTSTSEYLLINDKEADKMYMVLIKDLKILLRNNSKIYKKGLDETFTDVTMVVPRDAMLTIASYTITTSFSS